MKHARTNARLDSVTTTAAATLALLAAHAASAAIVSVSGQASLIGAPPSAVWGALPGGPAYCWDEQQSVTTSGVNVNLAANGFYTGPTPNLAAVAGTFDSHFIHFDASSGVANAQGTVVFSSAIVAVIYENVLLDATDLQFGAPATLYPTTDPFRSMTAALMQTQVTITGNTLVFDLWTQNASMQNRMAALRVLTDAQVPAPGAAALLALAGLAVRRRR
ncbi:MAG: hypothetical protein RI967_2040 [Planctomycetota bacterium]|jgi:MYXO-CTERM domain-containing protein